MAKKILDLSDRIFGALKVIGPHEKRKSRIHWRCLCSCGAEKWISSNQLRQGKARSCGCMMGSKRHGHTWVGGHSSTYASWANMLARCTQLSSPSHEHYAFRKITVCRRWRSFENFLADMGQRPGEKREFTLERIDNRKGYSPQNCRWATWKEQARNRSTTKLYEYRGEKFTLPELSQFTGVSFDMLVSRLRRSKKKWSVEAAVHTPRYGSARRHARLR